MVNGYARALLCALLVTGTGSAHAGWGAPPAVSGTVQDAWPAPGANGVVGVATSTQAYAVTAQGITDSLAGGAVTAFWDGSGCLISLNATGQMSVVGGCNHTGPAGVVQGTQVMRMRRAPGGWAAACGRSNVGSSQLFFSNTGGASNWTAATTPERCTGVMAMLAKGGNSYLLQAADPNVFGGNNNLLLYKDGLRAHAVLLGSGTPPVSVALVDDPTGLVAYAVDAAGALWRSLITSDQFGTFSQVVMPQEVSKVLAVALHQGTGERFGMALVETTPGTRAIYSAVPFADASLFGSVWLPSTAPPSFGAAVPKELHCDGANACAVTTDAVGAGGVHVYENAQPPAAFTGPSSMVAEGAAHPFTVSVNDPDGDAVVVTWTADPGNPPATLDLDPDGKSGTFHAPVLGGLCSGGQPFIYTLTATDGRTGHETTSTVIFTVTRATPPLAPVVAPSPLSLEANGAPGRIDASPAAGECAGLTYDWSPLSQDGITLSPGASGAFVDVTPPTHVCNAAGLSSTFEVRASNAHGASSATQVQVTVAPWGPPEPAFNDGITRIVTGGTSETLTAAQAHVCHTTTGGLPEVHTEWRLQTAPPANVTLTPPLSSSMPTPADAVTVQSADACDEGTFTLLARNQLASGAGGPSAERAVTVTVEPDLQPLSEATLTLSLDDSGGASGTSDVGINCVDQRNLSAEFLLSDGQGFEHREKHPVPGPWSLDVPVATCVPTTLRVQATLADTGGQVVSNALTWTSEGDGEPGLGELAVTTPLARCEGAGVVAEGSLVHTAGSSGCLGQQVAWTHEDGPATLTAATGDSVTVRASGAVWDEVIGTTSTFSVRATAGDRESEAVRLQVGARAEAPFVDAQVTVDPPLTSDASVVTVDVLLTNTSGCAVQSGSWVSQLERLRYVPGSARLDDQVAAAREEEGLLVVDGILLPPGGRARLRLLARPALYGEAQALGWMQIRQEVVSRLVTSGGEVAPASCGCGTASAGGGAASLLWACGALSLWLRGRRRSGGQKASRRAALPPGPEARSP